VTGQDGRCEAAQTRYVELSRMSINSLRGLLLERKNSLRTLGLTVNKYFLAQRSCVYWNQLRLTCKRKRMDFTSTAMKGESRHSLQMNCVVAGANR
jgi:hypothetical protein